jgi:hypothetical protein
VAGSRRGPTGGSAARFLRSGNRESRLDGSWIGANYGTSYLFFSVAPGEHRLCCFRTRIVLAFGFYAVEFEAVNSGEARLLLETSELSPIV